MLISTQTNVQTVSELTTALNRHLREFGDGWVEGEVRKWFVSQRGHVFFTIADEETVLDCRIWSSEAPPRDEHPAEGQLVKAHFVRSELWGAKGKFQLSVDHVEATGEGELLRRAAEILERLERDGLTDPARKRRLQAFPRRVGLIAGPDTFVDVVTHLRARFSPVEILSCRATLEGKRAVGEIVDAIGRLSQQRRVDVIVVARGGGSITDLFPFSDERLCRAIAACGVPVVTAIGHTPHRPNCDHVAAACAHVPAKVAELVVPSSIELAGELGRIEDELDAIPGRVAGQDADVAALEAGLDPHGRLERCRDEVEAGVRELALGADGFYGERRREIERWSEQLARVRDQVPRLRERVEERLGRVEGSRAHIRRRYSDYRTAVARHSRDARQAFLRLTARGRELVETEQARLRPAITRRLELERERTTAVLGGMPATANRRLERSCEAVGALIAVIRAHDFRERGWLLASTDRGPVRSINDLRAGDRLELRLHDGRASAQVEDIHSEKKENDDG